MKRRNLKSFNTSSSVMHLLSFEKELWIAKVEKCCRIFRWKLFPPECIHISSFYFTFKLTFQLSLLRTYSVGPSCKKLKKKNYLYSNNRAATIIAAVRQKLITLAQMKFLSCRQTNEIKQMQKLAFINILWRHSIQSFF